MSTANRRFGDDAGTTKWLSGVVSQRGVRCAWFIVQKQLDAYNARDLDGFLATYSEDIELYDYPNELFMQGKEQMRKRYAAFFEKTPDLHCEIKKRIVIGNKVIDEEHIMANGAKFSTVAIYEVENGKIAKVTFLR